MMSFYFIHDYENNGQEIRSFIFYLIDILLIQEWILSVLSFNLCPPVKPVSTKILCLILKKSYISKIS